MTGRERFRASEEVRLLDVGDVVGVVDTPLSLAGLSWPVSTIGRSATLAVLSTVSLEPPTSAMKTWIG